MNQYKIHMSNVMAVKDVVNMVSALSCEAILTVGGTEVDAKSIMSIFTLDLSEDFDLKILGEVPNGFEEGLRPYLV